MAGLCWEPVDLFDRSAGKWLGKAQEEDGVTVLRADDSDGGARPGYSTVTLFAKLRG
jgi:hypothetical protein